MATTDERLAAAHRALKRASQKMAQMEERIAALTNRIAATEKQLEILYHEVGEVGDRLKEQSRSIQKAAQGNYRSLDERISRLETEERTQNTDDTGTAI